LLCAGFSNLIGISYKKEGTVTRDFFDPTPEQQNVLLIDPATLRKAEQLIESCEGCNPESCHRFRSERDRLCSGGGGEVTELQA